MLVATEARRHRRPERHRLLDGHLGVAAHAVALHARHVLSVLEAKVLARELRAFANVRLAVARRAIVLVVRLRVTAETILFGREMKRIRVTGRGDAGVTRDAVDPFQNVSPVLERVESARCSSTQYARAGGKGEGHEHQRS